MPYVLSLAAQDDLHAIIDFVADDSLDGAIRVLDEIDRALARIGEFPRIGHRRRDLHDPRLRVWTACGYLIVYRPDADPVAVLRIVHGAMDLKEELARGGPRP